MAHDPAHTNRQRLDALLVERGLFATRSRARDAVLRGTVTVDGLAAAKPAMAVSADADLAVHDPAAGYVSRAALKLKAGLDAFAIDPAGSTCLDIGASTGGFTQVLLEKGATHVTAIDVGHDQMHASIAADPRVTVIEGLNARDLTAANLGDQMPDLVVCDVSFISLKLALPPALGLAAPGALLVALVKPQFEAGRDKVGKGGIVSEADGLAVAADLSAWLAEQPGWSVTGLIPSPIAGGDGNQEFLMAGAKA